MELLVRAVSSLEKEGNRGSSIAGYVTSMLEELTEKNELFARYAPFKEEFGNCSPISLGGADYYCALVLKQFRISSVTHFLFGRFISRIRSSS